MSLNKMTAHQLHKQLLAKTISAEEITNDVFKRIDHVEQKVRAYISLTKDQALETARQVDKQIAAGEQLAPLAGIPVAVKDNICTKGVKTTCASKMLASFVSPYDATVMERLKHQGAVMVGKTNMDEFAMGSTTETSYMHPTGNPWDTQRIPGGSSGGSAAAVAADQCIVALGSDTGGSIRQPAALCGVVGLKPSYGAVSRYGCVAVASSMDQIGPITKDVTDSALMLNALCGHDHRDSTSAQWDVPDYSKYLQSDVRDLKIGLPKEYFTKALGADTRQVIDQAIASLTKLGAEVEETSLPHVEHSLAVYYIIAAAEASSNLARLDGVRYGHRNMEAQDILEMFIKSRSEGFGAEVKRRLILGTHVLSAGQYDTYYLKAMQARTLIKQDFDQAFEKYDLLLSPTTPAPAFKLGDEVDPIDLYLNDLYTVSVNLAGLPGISIPCGFVGNMPVGLQLIAKPFAEGTLLRAAYTFEQNTEFHQQRPTL